MHTNIKIDLAPESGEIYYSATWVKPFWPNMHPDELICQFVLNLKMSITKDNWSFIWNSKSLYATKSKNDATNNQIFEAPTQPQITGLLSIFVQIQSLCLLLFLRFSP